MCERGKKYLRLEECGLKMMSGELEESLNHEQSSKQTKCFRGSRCLGQLWDVYGIGRCKQGGECWCYGDYRLRKVVSELKRAWGSSKKA